MENAPLIGIMVVALGASPVLAASGPLTQPVSTPSPSAQWISLDSPVSASSPSIDEGHSLNLAPPYAIYQRDPGLNDIDYGTLCFPASLANSLIWQSGYRQRKHPELLSKFLPDALDQAQSRIDANIMIRRMAYDCWTMPDLGTGFWDGANCIQDYYASAGLKKAVVQAYMPASSQDLYYAGPGANFALKGGVWLDKSPTPETIRAALDAGSSIIMSVTWFTPSATDGKVGEYVRGHYFNVYGYDYSPSSAENQMVLDVSNPDLRYQSDGKSTVFNTATMTRISAPVIATYPSSEYYTLSGPGFDKAGESAYVDAMFVFSPGD